MTLKECWVTLRTSLKKSADQKKAGWRPKIVCLQPQWHWWLRETVTGIENAEKTFSDHLEDEYNTMLQQTSFFSIYKRSIFRCTPHHEKPSFLNWRFPFGQKIFWKLSFTVCKGTVFRIVWGAGGVLLFDIIFSVQSLQPWDKRCLMA